MLASQSAPHCSLVAAVAAIATNAAMTRRRAKQPAGPPAAPVTGSVVKSAGARGAIGEGGAIACPRKDWLARTARDEPMGLWAKTA